MSESRSILQPVDEPARALARRLIRTARFGALAVLEVGSGHPVASRVSVAPDIDGAPAILISSLSPHTAALDADGRCSLLLGEPRRGDPLAHPRISLIGSARRLERGSGDDERVRRRFLARHPKASLYAGFADFAFFKVEPLRASLNGGFGRAFDLARPDLLPADVDPALLSALAAIERGAVEHMNSDHAEAVALYATVLCRAAAASGDASRPADWRIVSIDPIGLDLMDVDRVERLEFDAPLIDAADLRPVLVALAARARKAG